MADGGFSKSQEIDNPICPCQQGNVFAAYCPQGAPPLTGYVNGTATQIPLAGPLVKNGHSLGQTSGALELQVGDQRRTLVSDLSQFSRSQPEEVGLAVGTFESTPAPSRPQTQGRLMEYAIQNASGAESEDVYNLAIPTPLVSSAPESGEIDIETADETTIRWLAVNIVTVLGQVDAATGAQALSNATGGDLDFTLTGTNTPPLAIELIDMLRRKGNRQFLRDVFKSGTRVFKVWTNSAGNLMMSFRGYAGLRPFLNAPAYGVGNAKVSVISAAVRNSNQWAGTLRSVGGRIPVISYIIVGTIDVAQWLALPAAEQDFTDLLSTLFVDISKLAISTIAGAAAAALLIFSAPAWVVVAAGISAAVFVGVGLDIIDNAFGITQKVKDLANAFQASMESFAEGLMEVVEPIEEFLTNAEPGDGRITGPTDYLMEVDTGIRRYIYSRINWP